MTLSKRIGIFLIAGIISTFAPELENRSSTRGALDLVPSA